MSDQTITTDSRSKPFWLLISAACVVPALLSAFTSHMNSRFVRHTSTDWGMALFSGGMWLAFGALIPITYVLSRRFPLRREKLGRSVAAHFVGALMLSLGWSFLGVLLSMLLGRNPPQESLARYSTFWLLTNFPWAVALYFAVLGCIHAVTYYREARERESQQARLAAQLSEAKLSALRMQLNPHFLFNSLNAITVLVRDRKTQDASRMLELLSAILRQVLQNEKRQQVTLQEELRFIERYLAIEEVRFSDRLKVHWSIQPALDAALVPEFILQPLVENAIKHGVAKSNHVGVVEIRAELAGSDLLLAVEDNGPGYEPSNGSGVGLANIRTRLETSFGSKGKLEVCNSNTGGTVASVRFPFRLADAQ